MAINSKIESLYDALHEDGADVGTVEEFNDWFLRPGKEGYENRKYVYDTFKADGADVGRNYEEFSGWLGLYAVKKPQNKTSPTASASPVSTKPKASDSYFKARRGGVDFTIPSSEVEAAGGLQAWEKAHPGAPLRVYMQGTDANGKPFAGHVAIGDAHKRRQERGYKYTTVTKPIGNRQQKSQQGWQPSKAQVAAFNSKVEAGRRTFRQQMEEGRERARNLQEYNKSAIGLNQNKAVKSAPQWNAQTGKFEDTYLTSSGERMTDKNVADVATRQYNDAVENMTVSGQLRKARRELVDLRGQLEESATRVKDEWAEDHKKNNAPLASVLSFGTYVPRQKSDPENAALRVAIRQKEEQIKDLEEQLDRDNGVDVGFWRGFGRVAGDFRTWDFGMSDLTDAMTMLNADHYNSDKATEGEKRAGQEMMQALYERQQVEQMYGGNASFWNRAGVMTGYMPSFMIDFALTGGGYEAVNLFGKAATKGAVKWVGKEAVEEMAKKGFRQYVKEYGLKGLGREAMNWTIKSTGTMADELLIRAPLMANSVQAADVTADAIKRKLGDVVIDENGNYDFSNDKTWGSAIWQAEANAAIENFSEMFGAHLGSIPWSKLANTMGAKRLSGMLARVNSSGFGKVVDTTRKQLERLGVSDYFGEVTEEYYGQVWRTMLNLDDAYTGWQPKVDEQGNPIYKTDNKGKLVLDEQGNPIPEMTRTNLLATGQFHGDIWGGMALSMGLMGAGKYTLSAAGYANMKHQVNVADKRASEIITPEEWEPLRNIIDNTPNEVIGDLADRIMADETYSKEQRGAIMDYMERSLNMRGYNLATLAQGRGAEVNPDEQQLNESYLDGQNARTPQEMNDAKNAYEYQRQRLGDSWLEDDREDMFNWIEGDPINALRHARLNWDEEGADLLLDYLNAKMVYEGMMQGVRDGIDEQVAASDAMIEGRVNTDTGQIHSATMKMNDRKVYVVGGHLILNDDGTVDKDASDKSLVIRDAETCKLEFTDPSAILLGEQGIDATEQKQIAAEQIRQEYAQRAANHIDGVLPFKPGDTYTIDDGSGQLVDVTLVGPAINEEGAQLSGEFIVQWPNGQTTVFDGSTLKAMSDAANLERLNQFEQERQAQRQQRRTEQAEANRPQYNINDELSLEVDGQIVRGSVTATENEDGLIEVFTEDPINGNKVNMFTREELDAMLHEQTPALVGAESTAQGTNNDGAETVATVATTPSEDAEAEDAEAEIVEESAESALSRIPLDEKGKPDFGAAESAELAWDGMVERMDGDEEMSQTWAEMQVAASEKALAAAERVKPSSKIEDIDEFKESEKQRKGAIADAKARLEMWRKIAGVRQARQQEMERRAEIERQQEEQRLAEERKAQEEAARAAREEKVKAEEERLREEREERDGIPEMRYDTPAAARQRGKRRIGTTIYVRQEPITEKVEGKEVTIDFNEKKEGHRPRGHMVVIEASQGQASHMEGKRNPMFFIDEAQPKDRVDAESILAEQKHAREMNPELITDTRDMADPFRGAPTVNSRGEVIQGNHRMGVLRYMYANEPESQKRYKDYLLENAEKFGFTPEQVEAISQMREPIMVNMLEVEDPMAIELGQDTGDSRETGGKARINAGNLAAVIGDKMGRFMDTLLTEENESEEGESLRSLIRKNGLSALKYLRDMDKIDDRQFSTAVNDDGSLSDTGVEDIEKFIKRAFFAGESREFEEMFNTLPARAQSAVLSQIWRDSKTEEGNKVSPHVKEAVKAFYAMLSIPQFKESRTFKDALQAAEMWRRQLEFGEDGETVSNMNRYSNFAIRFAAMLRGSSMKETRGVLKQMLDWIQGTKSEVSMFDMMDEAEEGEEDRTFAGAVKRVLEMEYVPGKESAVVANVEEARKGRDETLEIERGESQKGEEKQEPDKTKENGENGGFDVAGGDKAGPSGKRGSSRAVTDGERTEGRTEPSERGAGVADDSAGRGGREAIQRNDEGQDNLPEGDPEVVDYQLSDEVDEDGSPFVLSSNGNTDFGVIPQESGLISAPIKLSLGNSKYGLIHLAKRHGDEIRNAGFESVESFVEYVANNFSLIREGENSMGEANGTYLLQLEDEHNNTLYVELSTDGSYWGVNSGGVFRKGYGKNKKEVWSASEEQNKQSATDNTLRAEVYTDNPTAPNGTVSNTSDDKVTTLSSDKQISEEESSLQEGDGKESEKESEESECLALKKVDS